MSMDAIAEIFRSELTSREHGRRENVLQALTQHSAQIFLERERQETRLKELQRFFTSKWLWGIAIIGALLASFVDWSGFKVLLVICGIIYAGGIRGSNGAGVET